MKCIFLTFAVVLFISCNNQSPVQNAVSNADSVYISFNDTTAIKKTSITDKAIITQLSEALAGKEAPEYKCGYDGTIFFYEKGKEVLNADFISKQKDCMHFRYTLNNQLVTTELSAKIAEVINK